MYAMRAGERMRRVRNLTPRWSSSPRTAWVVTFWSMTSMCGSVPETFFQWSQNAMASRFWVALETSALGAGGYVVAFQGGVLSPVHDGVEVQVEDGLLGGGQPGRDHGGVQAGEEGALVVVAGAVGVLGQGRLLRQGGQPGQQGRGRVVEQQG